MNTRDLFFSLLRNAIKKETLDMGEIEKSLSSEKLATLFKVAKKHDVAHLVCYALETNGFSNNSDTWQDFLKEKKQAQLRYEVLNTDLNELLDCFEKNRIEHIPLKGTIVRSFYPEPWMRTSCDIDILVRDEELTGAVELLVKKYNYTTDYKKAFHDITLYSPFGTILELHHSIKETIEKYDEILTRVWEYSKKEEGKNYRFIQVNEFMIFHLIAHMAYHFIGGGCGVRSVLDIWLLNRSISYDEAILNELLEKAGLYKFYKTVTELGKCWFESGQATEKTILDTEKYILLGGTYGTKKQGDVSKQVKKGGKLKYIFSRIFLSYEGLSILYPIIKKHKALTPFCQILRWFSVIFKTKRIKNEIKNVATTSPEEANSTRELFSGLGL